MWNLHEDVPVDRKEVTKIETEHRNVNDKKLVEAISKDIKEAATGYIFDHGIADAVDDLPFFVEDYLQENYKKYGLSQIDVRSQMCPMVQEINSKVKVSEVFVLTANFNQKHCLNTTKLKFIFYIK